MRQGDYIGLTGLQTEPQGAQQRIKQDRLHQKKQEADNMHQHTDTEPFTQPYTHTMSLSITVLRQGTLQICKIGVLHM